MPHLLFPTLILWSVLSGLSLEFAHSFFFKFHYHKVDVWSLSMIGLQA
jgi:hypothetical protein